MGSLEKKGWEDLLRVTELVRGLVSYPYCPCSLACFHTESPRPGAGLTDLSLSQPAKRDNPEESLGQAYYWQGGVRGGRVSDPFIPARQGWAILEKAMNSALLH